MRRYDLNSVPNRDNNALVDWSIIIKYVAPNFVCWVAITIWVVCDALIWDRFYIFQSFHHFLPTIDVFNLLNRKEWNQKLSPSRFYLYRYCWWRLAAQCVSDMNPACQLQSVEQSCAIHEFWNGNFPIPNSCFCFQTGWRIVCKSVLEGTKRWLSPVIERKRNRSN